MYNISKLINILLAEVGYIEKKKNCPINELYKKLGSYVGSDNWTKYWKDCADAGLPNYQGSYYCIATLFWGMVQAYGLPAAQKLCKQKFMINCQATHDLFLKDNQVYNTPLIGDIVVFWNGSRFHHAELVIDVKGDIFKTFGANTSANSALRNGGGCYAPKSYSIISAQRSGHKFLRPEYGMQRTEGWEEEGKIWKYRLCDGSYVKDSWKYIDGRWYVFDGSGAMITGWYLDSNNQWYYLCGDGGMAQGWQCENGKWYYLNQSGEMHKGWLQSGDNWYYLKEDGTMFLGWLKLGEIWYVFDYSGKMISDSWFLDSSGDWYFLSSTGAMKTSQWIQQKDGKWYYVDKNGKMAKDSWVKDIFKDIYYFVDNFGIYQSDADTTLPNKHKVVI